MKGLTMRLAKDEEEALNMLFEVCVSIYSCITIVGQERLPCTTTSTKLQWQQCTSLDVVL